MRLDRLPRTVFLLALTSLLADISTEMLVPVLPLFLTQQLGAPGSVVGIVEGVAAATQNLVQGFSGWLADRTGRSKSLALAGYGLSALAKPTMGLAAAWPHLLGGRFADRLGSGLRSAPRDALIAGSVSNSQRGAAFGLEGLGDNLGAFAGPLVTAVLLSVLHVELRVVFFVAFLPALCAFLAVAAVREGRPRPVAPGQRLEIRSLPVAYWRYLLCVAAFGIGSSGSAFIILKTTEVGMPTEWTLLTYAGFNLVAALVSYPAGALSDAWGTKRIVIAAFVVASLAYAGLALATSVWLVIAFFVLYGAYYGMLRAAGKTLAVSLVPEALKGSGIGLYSATLGLSALAAGILGGQLWDRFSHSATFAYGAACALLGIVLILVLVPARPATDHGAGEFE